MTEALPAGLEAGGRFRELRRDPLGYVVIDVDGTLLGDGPEPSDAVVRAIGLAREADVPVGFATGRMRRGVEALWKRLRIPGPHILHNGAEVRADGRTIGAWPLAPAQLATILDIADRLGAYAEIYVGGEYLVTTRDARAEPHWAMLGRPPAGVARHASDIHGEVLKVTFATFDGEPTDEIVAAVRQAGLGGGHADSPQTPAIRYVNVTHPEADKGNALRTAAAHLGVPLDQVAAIGDGDNDLPMLRIVGKAVAMGQAGDAVRGAAHVVAPSIENDGAAAALRWLLGPSRAP